MKRWIWALILLTGCADETPSRVEKIAGRLTETLLYQAVIPEGWERQPNANPLSDTTLPLASWKKEGVLITFHNFSPEISIPPGAQVARWKKQWAPLEEEETTPEAHGGFGGFRLEAYQRDQGLIAYAFQMNSTLQQKIQRTPHREGKADWTLKAIGPADQIRALEAEIDAIANCIELIEPIS